MTDSAAQHGVNRRLTARATCRLSVSYRHRGGWHPATAMDLSGRGCRLRLGEDLPRDASVTLRLARPAENAPELTAELPGRVIWSRSEGLSYQAGLLFTGESEGLQRILASL